MDQFNEYWIKKKNIYIYNIIFFYYSNVSLFIYYDYRIIIAIVILWVEFYALISKIFTKNTFKDKLFRSLYKALSLLYLLFLLFFILVILTNYENLKVFLFYSFIVAILSDVGGLVVGKIFKGKKLTQISPSKTVSGSIGSFIFSLFLIPFFYDKITDYSFLILILITVLICLITQLGDLFISYIKRKAKVKNTSNLLPGHGGLLDRVDGMIFAVPFGIFLFSLF